MSAAPRAKRSLGQNFLVDPNIQRKIVAELGAGEDDEVLEVGPGRGQLSRHLVGCCRRLVLVEKDGELAGELAERWGGRDDVEVVAGDALRLDLSGLLGGDTPLVISNVPYNITSPLVFALLALRPSARRMVLTVQREVARRIVAVPGGKTYGALSVGVQAAARATLVFNVGRMAFRPVPAVESAVVRIEPRRPGEAEAAVAPEALRDVTRACFSRRRKQLQKTLRTAPELGFRGDAEELLRSLGIAPDARPEGLPPQAFVALAAKLARS